MNSDEKIIQSLKAIPDHKWAALADKTIFFGHMSVGDNILQGIQDLMKELPALNLKIVSSAEPETKAGFYHAPIGRNTEPLTKMREFEKILTSEGGDQIDFAFMKLCYVDVRADSDAQAILDAYTQTIERIRAQNRSTRLIHFTVPLTTNQTGPKAWVKRLIGRPVGGANDNVTRFIYNDKITETYQGKDPVFDIALAESTNPDGRRMAFKGNSSTYYSLVPEYTYDNGHLNEIGRKSISAQFLRFLIQNID